MEGMAASYEWLLSMWRFEECVIEGGLLHGFGEWVRCIFLRAWRP
jgi:hypothetical protein